MKLADFLKCTEIYTKYTIADYNTDNILIEGQTAHTPRGNIKKAFKQYLNSTIAFLYAYDNKKIKIFIN